MYSEAIKQIRGLEYSNVKMNGKPNLIWKIKGEGVWFHKIRNQRASQHKVKFDDGIDNVSDYVARME